jgi:centromere/kinetochore protein ZW10
MWLAENLQTFAASWADRPDLGPRARGKVRLDNEISMLNKFARRAYGNEMSIQRTVLTDLLGGAQNLFAQDNDRHDDTAAIESVIIHIRTLSSTWKTILSKSAWAQAIGSLLSTVARKIILDVEDLPSLGADAAYRVANLISEVIKLDDLFLPEDPKAEQIPMTSQYAPNWLKLNFLSEVLQSDLKDVLYLWMESDLSLYFGVQEVVDLIRGSFEKSVRTREAIQRIRDTPRPRGVSADDR